MGHSSAVGFLAFVLCLVSCVSANSAGGVTETEPPEVNKETAEQAVSDAQNSITQVSEKATTNLSITKGVLEKVKSSKEKAEKAAVDAEQAATDNMKAKDIADNIKTISQGVTEQHDSVKEKLDSTIVSLDEVVSEVEKMKEQLNAVLPLTEAESKKNSEAKAKALEIKGVTNKLDTSITEALKAIDGVSSTVDKMEESAKDAELKNLQVSGIVAVAQIDTIIRDTGSYIDETQNKKREVNGIVQAMQDLKKQIPSKSTEHISELFQSTDAELNKATAELNKAEQYTTDMTTQKQKADAALSSIETTKEVNTAQQGVHTAKDCITQVNRLVVLLKSTLQTAKTSVTNAKNSKQKLETALSTIATEQHTEKGKQTENSDPSAGDGTQPHQIDTTIQPTSKDSLSQNDNSTDKLKDALINGAQNVPTTALTGGKAPAPGAKNDSAMTVSVPLLVALIASSILQ